MGVCRRVGNGEFGNGQGDVPFEGLFWRIVGVGSTSIGYHFDSVNLDREDRNVSFGVVSSPFLL